MQSDAKCDEAAFDQLLSYQEMYRQERALMRQYEWFREHGKLDPDWNNRGGYNQLEEHVLKLIGELPPLERRYYLRNDRPACRLQLIDPTKLFTTGNIRVLPPTARMERITKALDPVAAKAEVAPVSIDRSGLPRLVSKAAIDHVNRPLQPVADAECSAREMLRRRSHMLPPGVPRSVLLHFVQACESMYGTNDIGALHRIFAVNAHPRDTPADTPKENLELLESIAAEGRAERNALAKDLHEAATLLSNEPKVRQGGARGVYGRCSEDECKMAAFQGGLCLGHAVFASASESTGPWPLAGGFYRDMESPLGADIHAAEHAELAAAKREITRLTRKLARARYHAARPKARASRLNDTPK